MLKPDPHTAVLVQERVQEAIENGRLSEPEMKSLIEFNHDLERYLE